MGGQAAYTVNTGYDLAGRELSVLFAGSGQGVTYTYDSAGRTSSETEYGRALSYTYDAASNRASMTWPDGLGVTYTFDNAERFTWVGSGSMPAIGLLETAVAS